MLECYLLNNESNDIKEHRDLLCLSYRADKSFGNMRSVSIRPTRIYIMKPLHIHLRELKYRCLYITLSFVFCLIISWIYRYNIVHLYIFNVTDTLYALDVGEEMRISVYLSLYLSFLFTVPYAFYTYYCYVCPGMYEYEHKNNINKQLCLFLYIVVIYMLAHTYTWPFIYKILMGTSLGTNTIWGVHLDYMPRLSSIILWSITVPSFITMFSLVPMFIVSYTTIDSFKTYRRGWYLSSILVASLFCPAVPIIQFWCTFFLLSMYETTLMYLCITSKRV